MSDYHIEITNTRYPKTYSPPIANELKVTWKRKDDPGKLEFEVLNIGELDFQPGNPVILFENGKPVFRGYIFKKMRNSVDRIRCLAYDQIRYFKYKTTLQYENKTCDELIKMLADDRGLFTGALAQTNAIISRTEEDAEFYEIISHALEATLIETGKLYTLYDDVGKLTLKEAKDMAFTKFIFDEEVMAPFEYTVSIDDGTYNVIDLTVTSNSDEMGHTSKIHQKDNEHIKEWGLLQFHAITSDEFNTASEKAKKLLPLVSRPVRTLRLKDCKGDFAVRGGSLIVVKLALGDRNTYEWFMVESVLHKIKGNKHLMDIDVVNENFMEAIDISGAFPNQHSNKQENSRDGEGGDMVPEDSNAAKAWNILRKNGYSAAAAAGILGSLQAESGMNPRILQNGVGPGTGLAQWENPGRWPLLVAWAKRARKDPWTVEAQMEYLIYEFEGGETTSAAILSNRYGGLNKFKNTNDVKYAVEAFYWSFERGSMHRMDVRHAEALKFYNKWKDYRQVKASEFNGKFPPYNNMKAPNNILGTGQCTWYIWNRYYQLTGKDIPTVMGNGGQWASYARKYGMRVVHGKPFPGAAMCQQPGAPFAPGVWGHISFVETVNKDGSVVATGMWSGDGILHIENHPAAAVRNYDFIDMLGYLKGR